MLLKEMGVHYVLVDVFEGQNFEEESLPALLALPDLRLVDRFTTPLPPVREVYAFELTRP